jgi:hypothetical protein
MGQRIRSHLTYANVMVTILAFVVLGGGTALGAYVVSSNSQVGPNTISGHHPPSGKNANLIPASVNGQDVADNSLRGADIIESRLGKVPAAANADNATHLGGQPASDYRLHCPGNLDRAGDLCYEIHLRDKVHYPDALKACAQDQLRLPNDAELALVYNHLPASQEAEWTAGHFTNSTAQGLAPLLGQSQDRVLQLGAIMIDNSFPYRCVTSATN